MNRRCQCSIAPTFISHYLPYVIHTTYLRYPHPYTTHRYGFPSRSSFNSESWLGTTPLTRWRVVPYSRMLSEVVVNGPTPVTLSYAYSVTSTSRNASGPSN